MEWGKAQSPNREQEGHQTAGACPRMKTPRQTRVEAEKEQVGATQDRTGSWCQEVEGVRALRRKSGCIESERTQRGERTGLLSHRMRMLDRKEGVKEGV